MNALKKFVWYGSRNARLLAFAFLGISASAQADAMNETKSQALFMGSNILIRYKNALYPVVDLNGSYWVIEVNGERREIPTRTEHLEIKVVPAMKLTHTSAAISHLVAERDYTPPNDPSVRLTRDMAEAEKLNFGYQVLNNQAAALLNSPASHNAQLNNGTPYQFAEADLGELQGGSGISGIIETGGVKVALSLAATEDEKSHRQNYAEGSAGNDEEMYGRRGLSLGYDAMRVSFEINTDHVIQRPYVVTYTMFREKGTKPGMVRNLIYATALHQIDPRPQTIAVLEGGFPPNFEKVSFQLHLYEGQKEIATNVSSRRVDLTSDEAFEYLKMEYQAAHKGETLAAAPLMGTLPASFPETVRSGRYSGDYYVRISKDGMPEGVFRDASGTESLNDPTLEEIVRNIRFEPALEKGTPVEAMAPVNLHRLEF